MLTLISDKELSKYIPLERIPTYIIFNHDLISSVLYDSEIDEHFYVEKEVMAVMKLLRKLDRLVQQIELNRSSI